jgi:hypothetical protein
MDKKDILDFTSQEIKLQNDQIDSIPDFINSIQTKLDNLIEPLKIFDQRISELTVSINNKMYEIDTKSTEIINCGCANTVGVGTSGQVDIVGVSSYYDVAQITTINAESLSYTGINPLDTSTISLTSGVGENATVVAGNYGLGIETKITTDSGTAFFVSANSSGISSCVGKTCSQLSSQLSNLIDELISLKSQRTNLLGSNITSLKSEMKEQYTRRYSYIFARKKTEERRDALQNIYNITKSVENSDYFSE